MRKLTITEEQLEEIADNLNSEEGIRADYSGRGMYGKTCVGVVGQPGIEIMFAWRLVKLLKSEADVIGDEGRMIDLWDEQEEIMSFLADSLRSDNMGYDTIYYWPNLTVEG